MSSSQAFYVPFVNICFFGWASSNLRDSFTMVFA